MNTAQPTNARPGAQSRFAVLRVVPLFCLVISIADVCAEEAPKGPAIGCSAPHVIVPQDLKDWRVAVSVGRQPRYSRPRTEIASSGRITIKKDFSPDKTAELGNERSEALFESTAAFVNGFYLNDFRDDRRRDDGLKSYEIEVASSGRAVNLSFIQSEPSRMRLDTQALTVVDIVNGALSRHSGVQDMLPKPLKSDEAGRDTQIEGGPKTVPNVFPVHGRITLEIAGTGRADWITVTSDGPGLTYDLHVSQRKQDSHVRLSHAQAQEIYASARTVLCAFTLDSNQDVRAPVADERLELAVGVAGRRIAIRYEHTDDIPAGSRTGVARLLDLINAQIEPGRKKIEPIKEHNE
jgi:hypothetical protein